MAASNDPTGFDKEQIIGMAETEMTYRVDMFNRLTKTCFDKCIEKKYKESELNMGKTAALIAVLPNIGR